ncbi:MAG TPA: fimbria/pilus periplasmic chaperone [Ramlibacter sp.]|nr:fimbria/pilus periplasmic chaperone [Ramlibacter sp.]
MLATGFAPLQAVAGTFSVVPVRIYMTPRDRAVAITIVNEGDTEVALQADINTWRQKPDGTDEQVPTEDLVLSPPILKLPPRGRQVVRLARITAPDLSQQLTYRLIVREVPEAVAPKDQVIQIPIALALSMPVFITPPAAKSNVACQPARSPDGKFQVTCANTGTAYAQVREVQVRQGANLLGRMEGGVYILPGARKGIAVPMDKPAPAGPTQLNVTFDDGKSQVFEASLP